MFCNSWFLRLLNASSPWISLLLAKITVSSIPLLTLSPKAIEFFMSVTVYDSNLIELLYSVGYFGFQPDFVLGLNYRWLYAVSSPWCAYAQRTSWNDLFSWLRFLTGCFYLNLTLYVQIHYKAYAFSRNLAKNIVNSAYFTLLLSGFCKYPTLSWA